MLVAAPAAEACNYGACHSCRSKIVQQVYVPQAINYFVGAPIRVEAIVQKELRTNPLYQEFLQFKAWRAKAESGEPKAEGQPPTTNSPATIDDPALRPPLAALRASCGRCHGGPTPKAQLVLDGSAPLEARVITQALRQIAAGKMPPESAGLLSPVEKGAVMQELLSLEKQE